MKIVSVRIIVWFIIVFAALTGHALSDGRATTEEVYVKVVDAATVLEQLGKEGLEAFSNPKGEFVWKDSYVVVFNCKEMISHPINKLIGLPIEKIRCHKTGNPVIPENCKGIDKMGVWTEYWWPRPGTDKIHRKLMFTVPVEGGEWYVSAGIYDDTTTIKALNAKLK